MLPWLSTNTSQHCEKSERAASREAAPSPGLGSWLPCLLVFDFSTLLTLERHGLHRDALADQLAKAHLILPPLGVVEAGNEDGQLHVPVGGQELGHLLRTVAAGAPGEVPGHLVLPLGMGEQVVLEPREEGQFHMEPANLGKVRGPGLEHQASPTLPSVIPNPSVLMPTLLDICLTRKPARPACALASWPPVCYGSLMGAVTPMTSHLRPADCVQCMAHVRDLHGKERKKKTKTKTVIP